MNKNVEFLGKVGIIVADWDIRNNYPYKTFTTDYSTWISYISRKPVPAGTPLEDNRYWKPVMKPIRNQTGERYITFIATVDTHNINDILPEIGVDNVVYRIAKWDGEHYNITSYTEYAWDNDTAEYIILSICNNPILTVDEFPTKFSNNPVSSNGVFYELTQLGKDINLLSFISCTEVEDIDIPITPNNYKAGDIFFINKDEHGENNSVFVGGIIYYIAKSDGNADDILSDVTLFDSTYSGLTALNLSISRAYVNKTDYNNLLNRVQILENKVAHYHPIEVTINVNPDKLTPGVRNQINISAACTTTATNIRLYRTYNDVSSKLLEIENDTGITYQDILAPNIGDTILYSIETEFDDGTLLRAEKTVTVIEATTDYYVGWTNGTKAQFASKTDQELINGATGRSSISDPIYTRAFGDNNIFYLLYKADKVPTQVIFTSQGQAMIQNIVNDNSCPHADVVIDGVTYKEFGIREIAGYDSTDSMTIKFN